MITPRALAALLVLCCVACGPSARDKAIHAMTVATNVSRDKFTEADFKAQEIILATSSTKEVFDERIAKYRAKQAQAVAAFEKVYAAISAAAVLIEDPDLVKLYAAAAALQNVLEEIEGLLKGSAP